MKMSNTKKLINGLLLTVIVLLFTITTSCAKAEKLKKRGLGGIEAVETVLKITKNVVKSIGNGGSDLNNEDCQGLF